VRESEYYFDPDLALEELWLTLAERGIQPNEFPPAARSGGESAWDLTELSAEEGLDGLDDEGDAEPLTVGARGGTYEHTSTSVVPLTLVQMSPAESRSGGPLVRPAGIGRVAAAEVRAWARSQGLAVGERGRLHPDIVSAWNATFPGRLHVP